jgi:alpha-D-ribose 1-methylphosphonate 5-triphosphate synthase subunit PhnL
MNFLRESAFLLGLVLLGAGSALGADRVSVKTLQTHRGWTDGVVLGNGQVEAVMVPSIGRVMQFLKVLPRLPAHCIAYPLLANTHL